MIVREGPVETAARVAKRPDLEHGKGLRAGKILVLGSGGNGGDGRRAERAVVGAAAAAAMAPRLSCCAASGDETGAVETRRLG